MLSKFEAEISTRILRVCGILLVVDIRHLYYPVHLITTSFKKPQGKLLYVRLLKKANIARKFLPLRSKLLSVANPSLLLFGLALYYLALCCKTHKILNLMSNTFKTIEYKAYQGKRRSISIFRTFQK